MLSILISAQYIATGHIASWITISYLLQIKIKILLMWPCKIYRFNQWTDTAIHVCMLKKITKKWCWKDAMLVLQFGSEMYVHWLKAGNVLHFHAKLSFAMLITNVYGHHHGFICVSVSGARTSPGTMWNAKCDVRIKISWPWPLSILNDMPQILYHFKNTDILPAFQELRLLCNYV